MATLQVRLDLNKFKKDLEEVIERKVGAITTNPVLYTNLATLFHEFTVAGAGYDTGAFMFGDRGVAKNNLYREGSLTISRGHGIEKDAVEYRNNGNVHSYVRAVYGRLYGISSDEVSGKTIYENMSPGLKGAFLKEAGEMITETMKKA